jgi:hypothetical protein
MYIITVHSNVCLHDFLIYPCRSSTQSLQLFFCFAQQGFRPRISPRNPSILTQQLLAEAHLPSDAPSKVLYRTILHRLRMQEDCHYNALAGCIVLLVFRSPQFHISAACRCITLQALTLSFAPHCQSCIAVNHLPDTCLDLPCSPAAPAPDGVWLPID